MYNTTTTAADTQKEVSKYTLQTLCTHTRTHARTHAVIWFAMYLMLQFVATRKVLELEDRKYPKLEN